MRRRAIFHCLYAALSITLVEAGRRKNKFAPARKDGNPVVSGGLSFVEPSTAIPSVDGSLPYYTVGQEVNIAWTTQFPETTLQVLQRIDGAVWVEVLAQSYSPVQTTFTWRARPIDGSNTSGVFHFYLMNAINARCLGCHVNSASFTLSGNDSVPQSQSSLSSSASTSSSALASTSSIPMTTSSPSRAPMTTEATRTQTSPAQSMTAAASNPQSTSSKSDKGSVGIGVGVGLGVGIPVLAIAGLLAFLLVRRRRQDQQNQHNNDHIPFVAGPSPSTIHKSSISLPLPQEPSQASMPFRPSYTGRSEFSAQSNVSWFEPFEFEHPEMRERDAMSQLRRSIHSRRSENESSDGTSLRGEDLAAFPSVPRMPPLPYGIVEGGRF